MGVTCGTNFTVVLHSGSNDSAVRDFETTISGEVSQVTLSEGTTEAGASVWFKKPQTVDGFLDEQLQASALSDLTIATAQLETSVSLKSNMFLGRSIETDQFIPFPEVRCNTGYGFNSHSDQSCQATVEGLLKSQIAQSPYLSQEEKRSVLTEQNSVALSSSKSTQMRAILVRIICFRQILPLFFRLKSICTLILS